MENIKILQNETPLKVILYKRFSERLEFISDSPLDDNILWRT